MTIHGHSRPTLCEIPEVFSLLQHSESSVLAPVWWIWSSQEVALNHHICEWVPIALRPFLFNVSTEREAWPMTYIHWSRMNYGIFLKIYWRATVKPCRNAFCYVLTFRGGFHVFPKLGICCLGVQTGDLFDPLRFARLPTHCAISGVQRRGWYYFEHTSMGKRSSFDPRLQFEIPCHGQIDSQRSSFEMTNSAVTFQRKVNMTNHVSKCHINTHT